MAPVTSRPRPETVLGRRRTPYVSRHSRASGNPVQETMPIQPRPTHGFVHWIPACAGMTVAGRHARVGHAQPTEAWKAPAEWTKASGPSGLRFWAGLGGRRPVLPHMRRRPTAMLRSAFPLVAHQAVASLERMSSRPPATLAVINRTTRRAGGLCSFRRGLPGPGYAARNRAALARQA
jgi:hypothetical protein